MIIVVLTGLITGIISGMGIGGGTILIPVLTLLMGVAQKSAQGINLLNFLPTATVALYCHIKAGRVRKDLWLGLVLGGVLGALLGSWLANSLQPEYLRKGFGVFLFCIGVSEVLKKGSKEEQEKKEKKKIDQKDQISYVSPAHVLKSKKHRFKNKRKRR